MKTTTDEERPRTEQTVAIVIAVCAVALLAGYLLKAQCLAGFDGRQYARLCYNDIQPLYGIRSVAEDVFPYVGGEYTADGQLTGGAIEYPVLTGLFLWLSGLFVDDSNSYLKISTLLLAPFGLVVAYHLARMAGWRALLWAASPALVYYAFHNWDLLVVAAVAAGMWCWHRGRPLWAAALFGVGTALKMYPILFVVPLALERLVAGRRDEAVKAGAVGAGAALAANLPFMLINFGGWWATYAFHRARGPNYDSIWGLAQSRWAHPLLQMPTLNLVIAVLTLATFTVAVSYGWERARREGAYPFLPVAGALLVAFLLWNKVHSPQFTLWLLPFFVLLRTHVAWWVAYVVVDTGVYVGVFRWFYDFSYLGAGTDTGAYVLMAVSVWARAALLAALLVVFLRSRAATGDGDLSHPPDSVDPVGAATAT